MDQAEFLSIGMADRNDVRLLNPSFEQLWPLDRSPRFDELLQAIDQADRQPRTKPRALH